MTTSLVIREDVIAPVPRGRCMAALAGRPSSVTAAASIVLGTLALGAPLAMIPLLAVWMGALWRGSRSVRLQRAVARARRTQQLADRRDERELRLVKAGAPRAGLRDATELVDEISRIAPEYAAFLELEELLDRYADLAAGHARCSALVGANAPGALRAPEDMLVRPDQVDRLRPKVLARRAAFADQCRARMAELDGAMSDILELLRLIVERAAMCRIEAEELGGAADGTDGAIAKRLCAMNDDHR